jgi:DNA-binding CsgD family transcriptional regulator
MSTVHGRNGFNSPNPPALIERMRRLWDSGLTAGQISKRLKVSRNRVIGLAHRNGFAARPSPILPPPAPLACVCQKCGKTFIATGRQRKRRKTCGSRSCWRCKDMLIDRSKATALRGKGLSYHEIGLRLGCSIMTAHRAVNGRRKQCHVVRQ